MKPKLESKCQWKDIMEKPTHSKFYHLTRCYDCSGYKISCRYYSGEELIKPRRIRK